MQDFLGQGAGPETTGAPGGGLAVYAIETFETGLLDLTQTISLLELVPARPFYIPVFNGSRWVVEAVSGTQTSPATINAGNNAARSNFIPSNATTPINTEVNSCVPPCAITAPSSVAPSGLTAQAIANSPVLLDITSPCVGTGGFSLFAHLAVQVIWIAAGS